MNIRLIPQRFNKIFNIIIILVSALNMIDVMLRLRKILFPKKILVIEDEQFLLDLYVQILEEENFIVDGARSGEDGLNKMSQKYYDLIISEVLFSDTTGLKILERIKDNKIKQGKFVILSNIMVEEIINKAISLGADEYWVKQEYTPNQIIEKVKNII